VWFVDLRANIASVGECLRTLSAEEKERLSRYAFEQLKTDFTLSRGILRALLGRYLAIGPDRVRFAYGPRGKPSLAFPSVPFEFNVAHSGGLAAYAFAVGCELGVDIEAVRPLPDQEDIVRRFFSPEECDEWLALDARQRDHAFFRCWTRKEAYLKALGDGLSIPLDSFQVSLRPGKPAVLVRAVGGPDAASRWSLCSMTPAEGYVASLALPREAAEICAFYYR
jgi:4'-phosphopantetheinyl transferase